MCIQNGRYSAKIEIYLNRNIPEGIISGHPKAVLLLRFYLIYIWCCSFLCPRHNMVEGHIELTLSVCVFVCLCVSLCVPESCPGRNSAVRDGI